MSISNSFHAHHSPMGAHASFTVGMFGAEGGLALEKGSPAHSAVFIGYRSASGKMHTMPFYKGLSNDAERYSQSDEDESSSAVIFGTSEIKRQYGWANDCFTAPGIWRRASPRAY